MLEPFRDAQGRSSYNVLVDQVHVLPNGAHVLDLACGDGYLLSMLAASGRWRLAGLDRSPEEMSAARARLGPDITLHCQDASALPFPDRSLDLVVCHMALMLMEDLDSVLIEIARVLGPGRLLLAIINRPHPDPALRIYWREVRRVTAEAGLQRLQLGPPDIFSLAGLRALLCHPHFDENALHIYDFVVQLRASPQRLWSLLETTYDVFRLPDAAKTALQATLLSAWKALCDPTGHLTAALGLRLVQCPTIAPQRSL